MWILNWIPIWYYYIILGAGIIGFAITFTLRFLPIPGIYIYRTLIQMVSMALVAAGCFAIGYGFDNASFLKKVEELQNKVAEAENKSKEENVKIVEKVVVKTQIIKEKANNTIQYIDREIVKYDNGCVIPNEFVKAVNSAAEAPK